jgi:hypothetical protein
MFRTRMSRFHSKLFYAIEILHHPKQFSETQDFGFVSVPQKHIRMQFHF